MQGSRTPLDIWVWLLRSWASDRPIEEVEEELGTRYVRSDTARTLMRRLELTGTRPGADRKPETPSAASKWRHPEFIAGVAVTVLLAMILIVNTGQVRARSPRAAHEIPAVYQGVALKDGLRWHLTVIDGLHRRYTPIPEGEDPNGTLVEHHEAVARDQVAIAARERGDPR